MIFLKTENIAVRMNIDRILCSHLLFFFFFFFFFYLFCIHDASAYNIDSPGNYLQYSAERLISIKLKFYFT